MPGKIGKYEIVRTLGTGASCKVKLAIDSESGRKVAIKVINDNMDQALKQLVMAEVKAMENLKHDNVITQVHYGEDMYEKSNKDKCRIVSYIVLELALGGELFDFVANSGRFEEPVARYYFKQILEGLDYVH
jgi:serine/threonine protein kinase